MWIIPNTIKKDLEQLDFVPDMVDLNEDWKAQGLESSPSLLVKSKPMQLQTYWRKWKKAPYLAHLFGRTLKPSQWQSFAEKWTSLLGDSPASLSVQQEQEKETRTQDIYFPILNDSLRLLNQDICSWKTSMEFLPRDLKATTGQTQKERPFCCMCVESWKGWATAWRRAASMRKKWEHHIKETDGLYMENWNTPSTRDHKGSRTIKSHLKTGRNHMTNNLCDNVVLGAQLGYSGQLVPDQNNTTMKHPERFPTPKTNNHTAPRPGEIIQGLTSYIRVQNGHRMGAQLSDIQPQQLNPNWVEQLMGVPVGWTQLPTEWNEYECVEMGLYHKQLGELGQSYSGKLETGKKGKHQFTKSPKMLFFSYHAESDCLVIATTAEDHHQNVDTHWCEPLEDDEVLKIIKNTIYKRG